MASGRGVAQTGSAFAWGAKGPGFKSRRPDHLKNPKTPVKSGVFLCPYFSPAFRFPPYNAPIFHTLPGDYFGGHIFRPCFTGIPAIRPKSRRGTHGGHISPPMPPRAPITVPAMSRHGRVARRFYGPPVAPDGRLSRPRPGPSPPCRIAWPTLPPGSRHPSPPNGPTSPGAVESVAPSRLALAGFGRLPFRRPGRTGGGIGPATFGGAPQGIAAAGIQQAGYFVRRFRAAQVRDNQRHDA